MRRSTIGTVIISAFLSVAAAFFIAINTGLVYTDNAYNSAVEKADTVGYTRGYKKGYGAGYFDGSDDAVFTVKYQILKNNNCLDSDSLGDWELANAYRNMEKVGISFSEAEIKSLSAVPYYCEYLMERVQNRADYAQTAKKGSVTPAPITGSADKPLLNYLLAAGVFVAGSLVFSFTGVQILLVLFFAIPTTIKIKKESSLCVQTGKIYLSMFFTCLIQGFVIALCVWGLYVWGNLYATVGAAIGAGLSFILSISKLRASAANLNDYFNAYGKFISHPTPPPDFPVSSDTEEAPPYDVESSYTSPGLLSDAQAEAVELLSEMDEDSLKKLIKIAKAMQED